MLHLQSTRMLQMLEKSLKQSLPESIKVYGTVFHMNQGNPFNLKALVDKWPDFNTVVIRPQEQSKQEMTDDLDHYTNTYQIYSKDTKKCQELLGSPEIIHWKQHLQIQSTQSNLDEVIESLVAIKACKVKKTQCSIYVVSEATKKLVLSALDAKKLPPNGGKHMSMSNHEMFKLSSLDVTHAALVNKFWHFSGNERSQRFVERCIGTFPTTCLLGPEGTPVSWGLMDFTGEMRMAFTLPEYWVQGLMSHVIYAHIKALDSLGFPLYAHVDRANHIMQRLVSLLHTARLPYDWNQWHCVPL